MSQGKGNLSRNPGFKKNTWRRNVNAIQDKDWMKELTCYQCQEKGHISKDCPKWKGKAGKTFGQPGWKPKPDRMTFRQTRKFNNAKRLNLILKVKVEDKKYKPVRKTPGSAGYDLVPSESGMIKPGDLKEVKVGISLKLPEESVGLLKSRSKMSRLQIDIKGGVIDCDYTGPIILLVKNEGTEMVEYIAGGKAIAQLLIIPILTPDIEIVDRLEETQRKGGFGSTDKELKLIDQEKSGKLIFEGRIRGQKATIMIDSGADENFVSKTM